MSKSVFFKLSYEHRAQYVGDFFWRWDGAGRDQNCATRQNASFG